jgi:hypothetical protein
MDQPSADPRRQVLLVLGMHRSGTSATAGLLTHLGGRMARTPIQPDANNPRGYWEPLSIVELHNRLLAEAGSSWDDWGRLEPRRFGAAVLDELAAHFMAEFDDAPLVVLKDPRICRFVPLWLEVLGRLGIAPKVVIPLRHPLEVAGSLARRDGMPRDEALLLWLRHCLDAERATRGLPRSFLSYDVLMADWRGAAERLAAELDLRWPVAPEAAAPAVAGFLSHEMRHHVVRPGVEPDADLTEDLAPWVGASHAALAALAAGGGAADEARLDAVRTALDAADALMGTAARRQRQAAAEARAERAAALAARAEAEAAQAAAESHAAAQADAARWHAEAAAVAQAALAEARAGIAASEVRATELRAALAALEADRRALLGSTSWRLTAPLRLIGDRVRRSRRSTSAPQKS